MKTLFVLLGLVLATSFAFGDITAGGFAKARLSQFHGKGIFLSSFEGE